MSLTTQEHKICNTVDSLQKQSLEMLSDLVAFNSQIGNEQAAQDFMADRFQQLDLELDRFEIDEAAIRDLPGYSPALIDYSGRENVVGVYRPGSQQNKGRSLILNGHIDVVPTGPVDHWQSDPFTARIEGDRLYGRGSGDMKAGIVAYCTAFQALRLSGFKPAGELYLQSVIEEECTGNGALACLQRGYRADAAIIPEPFGQKIMNAQLGVMWLSIDVSGQPAHVLDTSAGVNAIEVAYDIFSHLKTLESQWNQAENRHASFSAHSHPVNFNLGKIKGGDWASTVPTRCVVDIRIGFYPETSLDDVKAEIEHWIDDAVRRHEQSEKIEVGITYQGFQAQGFVADPASPLFKALSDVHKQITTTPIEHMASTATTDARFFHLYGDTPATCYGPVSENYHSFDEWVSISSMMQVSKVLAVFIGRWCGLVPSD